MTKTGDEMGVTVVCSASVYLLLSWQTADVATSLT